MASVEEAAAQTAASTNGATSDIPVENPATGEVVARVPDLSPGDVAELARRLGIELDGMDVRTFGSRGQQRLLALALRLAEVLPVTEAAGTPPVLLLDDALSELDARARASVLREVESAEQVFLTMPDALDDAAGARWIVNQGGLAAA